MVRPRWCSGCRRPHLGEPHGASIHVPIPISMSAPPPFPCLSARRIPSAGWKMAHGFLFWGWWTGRSQAGDLK